jgi:chitinase
MKKTPHSNPSTKAKVLSRTVMASTLALLFASSAFAAPGAPALKAYEINGYGKSYGFVHIDQTKAGANAPYKEYVTVNKTVDVPLPFDIWSNGTATKAVAVIDGVVDSASQITLTPGTSQTGTVTAHPTKAGKLNFQVRAYDADGSYTDSAPLQVMVFDTLPQFADDLPNNVPANFKKYTNKSGSVVGTYFTTWSIYDRGFDMSQVPVEQLTHILYGFIPICGGDGINDSLKEQGNPYNQLQISCKGLPNYSVAVHDSWGEVAKLLPGQTSASPLKGVMGQMMAAKKRNPNLKILPSIGGWTLSDPFFQLDNVANRKVFVDSVEQFLRTWKFFDGVDIDWEFPGGNGANTKLGKPTDGATYVTLMKELRAMLDKLSAEYGKPYELTSAIGAGQDKIGKIDYKEATKYMNYIFDMTYDYYGGWDMNTLGHQTALHAPKWRPEQSYTSANSMQALLDQGVDPGKLVMGVAMYGRGWTGVHGMTDASNPFTGKATGPQAGQWEKGILDYKKIVKDMAGPAGTGINGYQYHYDTTAEAPYLYNPSNGDLITYDNAGKSCAGRPRQRPGQRGCERASRARRLGLERSGRRHTDVCVASPGGRQGHQERGEALVRGAERHPGQVVHVHRHGQRRQALRIG